MNQILSRENMKMAYKKVKANKGAGGIDGINVENINEYLKENWIDIKTKILKRKYKPQPVLRVEIPKPNGGVRNLGIPTVVDRIIEQAITQVLTPIFEPQFSEHSYGFRPGRRAQQAIVKLLEYLNDGYTYVVDIDLSPLLSNIMLNELDKELEARGLHFVRYADDCIITVASSAAANRVMHTVTSWIERKLSLKVNATKSKVTKPTRLKYLGFGFVKMNGKWEARPHKDSINRFKRKLKKLTYRSWSVPMDYRILRLNQVIRGWINYFRMGKMKQNMTKIDEHLRNRMRIVIWKQWKTSKKRMWGLRKLGVPEWMARQSVGFADHYQAVDKTAGLRKITKEILAKRGLISCLNYYLN